MLFFTLPAKLRFFFDICKYFYIFAARLDENRCL